MKRRFGIIAIAALSTLALSQLAAAESYDFWTASTPKRAESQAVSPKAPPIGNGATWEEYNEVTAVWPKRADATAAAPQPAPAAASGEWEEYNEVTAVWPKRVVSPQSIANPRSPVGGITYHDASSYNRVIDLAPL